MSEKLLHHFVPRYYFRLFNGGKRFIHLLRRANGSVVRFASVRGQCARRKFYGSTAIENSLADLEGHHATVLSAITQFARTGRALSLSVEGFNILSQAILLQRSRTPRALNVLVSGGKDLLLHVFHEYVKSRIDLPNRETLLAAARAGNVPVPNRDVVELIMSMSISLRSVAALSDLSLVLLRNASAFPFLMSDAPVVLYNRHFWHEKSYGVLGFQSRGLLIFFPLTPALQLMLYDATTYSVTASDSVVVVFADSDVAQLNALQLHSSVEAVYFAEPEHASHAHDLYRLHRPLLSAATSEFLVHSPGSIMVDGKPNVNDVMHVFEPHLPVLVDLSFIPRTPITTWGSSGFCVGGPVSSRKRRLP